MCDSSHISEKVIVLEIDTFSFITEEINAATNLRFLFSEMLKGLGMVVTDQRC